jgi:murein DD-endopeptidase MepM/ murein hydrolase activator NlpD
MAMQTGTAFDLDACAVPIPSTGFHFYNSNAALRLLGWILMTLSVGGCGTSPTNPTSPISSNVCAGFADWQTSPYLLPYSAGSSYVVDQGNCSAPGSGHRGAKRFGYDFLMPIGTNVTAARAGTVIHVEESHFDGQIAASGFDNFAVLRHDDGSTALYGHFTHDGVIVNRGDTVEIGALVGRSGNAGNTGNKPHLHLSIQSCDPVSLGTNAGATLPMNFRNTEPNPTGLAPGRRYEAS